ncbi:MAG: AI-2E family transporter [Cyclobacteriaceae bacterium]|nr:AI-2E family transporter [Cyclobacteriaceae bacterium]
MTKENFGRISILVITLGVSALFIGMIRGFLLAILMAALFTDLLNPIYHRFTKWFKGRTSISALLTIFLFILTILIPFAGLSLILLDQAISASKSVVPLINEIMADPQSLLAKIESVPIISKIFPDQAKLLTTIGNIVEAIGNIVVSGLTDVSTGAVGFVFSLFIFLFTLYYFLVYGSTYLRAILYYLPLKDHDEQLLLTKFSRVTRATLKGTFLIGLIQGTLGAVGMAIAGIPNVVFWGMLMVVSSVVPALGPALIWFPAALFLIIKGHMWSGILLILWGAIVIGNIDNLLRPRLVGKDAQMPDLMILFGTLGGLSMFGMVGIIIGPIIAGLFLTLWEIYGQAFKDLLYPVKSTKEMEP